LCVLYAEKKYPLELKLKYSAKTEPEGLEQLGSYMEIMGAREGWLVIFDRNKDTSWENKLYRKTVDTVYGTIHVVGC